MRSAQIIESGKPSTAECQYKGTGTEASKALTSKASQRETK